MARPAKNYIVWRDGSAMVRVQITDKIARKAIGKTALRHTLGKVSKCEAAKLSLPFVADYLDQIERAKLGTYTSEDSPVRYFHTGTPHSPYGHISAVPPENGGQWIWHSETTPVDKPVTFTEILNDWALENKNADTFKKFTRMMSKLSEFTKTDNAKLITPRQIIEFETSLRRADKPLHVNTISNYLGCYNAVFTFAKRKHLITVNPMIDVEVPGKVATGKLGYSIEQVQSIVTASRNLRIELFLCVIVQAYTGVRISEIANRLTSDITEIDGVWCLSIPKGKTESSIRKIALHPQVLKVLLPYRDSVIATHGEGFLFPNGTTRKQRITCLIYRAETRRIYP